MSAAGTYARVPMGEAFDVMCQELDDIVNRMCGIEEVALAYAWLQNVRAGLGGEGAVGQAAVSSSAATNRELERAPSPPSLALSERASDGRGGHGSPAGFESPSSFPRSDSGQVGEPPPTAVGGTGGSPTRHLAAVPEEAS